MHADERLRGGPPSLAGGGRIWIFRPNGSGWLRRNATTTRSRVIRASGRDDVTGTLGQTFGMDSSSKRHVFLDPDGTWRATWLVVVVEAPTGVIYEQQCAGTGTDQRAIYPDESVRRRQP